ncbi:hypothetical protein [Ammoniphilus resinae]|uniref:Uncharacterized protein n=1 Tax=Ammoniphilus resinae TaxID=861532 RepID=A0ABS4GSM1_9BACL|nr:hypothetical protein [Ammoniphilus resinae]MBP1933290.1 hypothetical protein [Ammoniphilus resinae]
MLRSDDSQALNMSTFHGASTLGFLHQLSASYEVTWLLPRLDFHQLAISGLPGHAAHKKRLAVNQALHYM